MELDERCKSTSDKTEGGERNLGVMSDQIMEGRSDSNGLACISLDLNLIENLWNLPSTRVKACQLEPRNLVDLRAAVHEEWIVLPQWFINRGKCLL